MHDEFKRQLNRVAETQYVLRPILKRALECQILTDDARKLVGNYSNYAEFWAGSFSERFFDMATLIRLGSAIEGCLKWYYMSTKRYANIPQLMADPAYENNIFQRVQSWQHNGVISLYRIQLGYDVATNPDLLAIQEAMMHRHLYAHNSGLIDDEYIDKIKRITGQDLAAHPEIGKSYPNDDTYWFEPLKRMPTFIEEARQFFGQYP